MQTGEKQEWVCVCETKTERLITFFLIQYSERLHQLMFGTLHQSQPSFAFFLKRSEQTKKKRLPFQSGEKHVHMQLKYTEIGLQAVTWWHINNHRELNRQKLFLAWNNGSAKKTLPEGQISHAHDNSFVPAVIVVLTQNINQHWNCFTWHEKYVKKKKPKKTWEWKASYRSASLCRWTTSGMTSFLSRTPCWGLFCKQWSSDPHP